MHENNELRHKVVYIGSRCEQIEAEYIQTKEYLNSELKKANDRTDQVRVANDFFSFFRKKKLIKLFFSKKKLIVLKKVVSFS